MQPLLSTATVKYLLESIKPNTKTSKRNLQPLKGKSKQTNVSKLWFRSSAAENHYGFRICIGAMLTYISSGKAVLSCSWSKGSSPTQTTSLPEIGDSQASQVSHLDDLLLNLWAASCKHVTPLEAALTVVSASTDRETSFYNSQQQSHIIMLFTLLGILWWVVQSQDDFFFCPTVPDWSKVHFCLCLL